MNINDFIKIIKNFNNTGDIVTMRKEILRLKDELNKILADLTGQPLSKVINDCFSRIA